MDLNFPQLPPKPALPPTPPEGNPPTQPTQKALHNPRFTQVYSMRKNLDYELRQGQASETSSGT